MTSPSVVFAQRNTESPADSLVSREPSFFRERENIQKKYAISTFPAGGLGDLVAGATLVFFLRQQGVNDDNIIVCTKNSSEMNFCARLLGSSVLLSKERALEIQEVALHIMSPVPVSVFIPEYIATKKPLLIMSEYGMAPFPSRLLPPSSLRTASFGLGREELGIFVDQDLFAWSQLPESQTGEARKSAFQNLSEDIQRCLMREEPTIEGFFEKNRLYFGYAFEPSSAWSFLLAIDALQREDDRRNLVVVMPRLDMDKLQEMQYVVEEEFSSKSIKCVSHSGERGRTWFHFNSRAKNERRILLVTGSFDFSAIEWFLKASEKETIATGDQSVSLALSAGKCVVYEARTHKQHFAQELQEIFGEGVRFDVAQNQAYDSLNKEKCIMYFRRHQADGYHELNDTTRRICIERDCRRPFIHIVEEVLEAAQRQEEWPLVLPSTRPLSSEQEIPFNIPIVMTTDQYDQLRINSSTNRSPFLPDSLVESEGHCGFLVVVRRHL